MKSTDRGFSELQYPEHEKLNKIKDQSQTCGLFLEWLQSRYSLCTIHEHNGCEIIRGSMECGMRDGEYQHAIVNIQGLLGEFFHIDQEKLNTEKDQMLKDLRAMNR